MFCGLAQLSVLAIRFRAVNNADLLATPKSYTLDKASFLLTLVLKEAWWRRYRSKSSDSYLIPSLLYLSLYLMHYSTDCDKLH